MSISMGDLIRQSSPYEDSIQQLVKLESQKLYQLEDQQDTISDKKSALGDISSKVTSFINKIEEVQPSSLSNPLDPYTSSSSDESVVTIDSYSGIKEASAYNITVDRLATKDTMLSATYDGTASTLSSAAGTGSVDITVGTATETITVDTTGKTDEEVLQAFADEINNLLGDSAKANLFQVDENGTVQLSVQSRNTGYDERIQFSNASDDLVNVISSMDRQADTDTDLDAQFTIDGVTFTRGENTVSDAIDGMTFTLQDSGTANMSVSRDIDGALDNIQEFIDSYNEVNSIIRRKTYIRDTGEKGILQSERSVRNLSTNLRMLGINDMSSAAAGELKNLTEIGIAFDNEGNMSIDDSAKLKEMLTDRQGEVENLFTAADSPVEQMKAYAESYTDSGGVFSALEDGFESRIARLDNRIESEERYLERYEERQRNLFAELEQIQLEGQNQYNEIMNYQSQLGMM